MEQIDTFSVDKLLNSLSPSAIELGWKLYNRTESMSVDELSEVAVLVAKVLEEISDERQKVYNEGYDDGYAEGKVE